MSTHTNDRTIECGIDINAEPDVVWQALTTENGLNNWFSYQSKVTPGVGGSLYVAWGDFGGGASITKWDPPRHMQMLENRGPYVEASTLEPVDITVDYFIEARDGGCELRIVQAGLGPEADWDGEYNATIADWPMFMSVAAHYAEHHALRHPGLVRTVNSLATTCTNAAGSTWTRLVGGTTPVPGEPCTLTIGDTTVEGTALLVQDGSRVIVDVPALNDGTLVATVSGKGEQSRLSLVLSTWAAADSALEATTAAIESALEAMSGTGVEPA
ncbi:MAG: SRPBCC family protein [Planctomycetota bacterium]|jgi:uncharacterized protein YndB with AHSA1/START domain